jgi:hypothetical protein
VIYGLIDYEFTCIAMSGFPTQIYLGVAHFHIAHLHIAHIHVAHIHTVHLHIAYLSAF